MPVAAAVASSTSRLVSTAISEFTSCSEMPAEVTVGVRSPAASSPPL